MNEKVIDWSAYADEDIARFLEELTEEREKRQAGKRKALKEQIIAFPLFNGYKLPHAQRRQWHSPE